MQNLIGNRGTKLKSTSVRQYRLIWFIFNEIRGKCDKWQCLISSRQHKKNEIKNTFHLIDGIYNHFTNCIRSIELFWNALVCTHKGLKIVCLHPSYRYYMKKSPNSMTTLHCVSKCNLTRNASKSTIDTKNRIEYV